MRLIPLAAMTALLLSGGCREERKLDVASTIDPEKMPSLSTRNVSTLISDSGVTKYKVVTPLWNIYSETGDPCWKFPEGVYLRQFDRKMKVVATVAADSAVYYTERRLWRLEGNVEIDQRPDAFFTSQRIFFDDRRHRIYSDTFIHIETPTQILEGVDFEANEDLTNYTVRRPTGVFPVKNEGHPAQPAEAMPAEDVSVPSGPALPPGMRGARPVRRGLSPSNKARE